jgi:hypothetical protein
MFADWPERVKGRRDWRSETPMRRRLEASADSTPSGLALLTRDVT